MFHVINLDTSEPVSEAGEPFVFATGQEAASFAKTRKDIDGGRYQPRPVPVNDEVWRAREAGRLADGTYTRLPWDDGVPNERPYMECRYDLVVNMWIHDVPSIHPPCWHYAQMTDITRHHYAHVSLKVPGNIAFTENSAKGAADIQSSMKPGRYLKQFYGDYLDERSIRNIAQSFIAQFGLVEMRFATTADEIENVYANGPHSCMAGDANHFDSPVHPARVYGAGDLHAAYLATDDDAIPARALCWPEKKVYGRVYGDDKLELLLQAAGYAKGEFNGAKLARIECGDSFVMPYLDGIQNATDHGDHLTIDRYGDISCVNTNGLSECGEPCNRCRGRMDDDESCYIEDIDAWWCRHCAEHHAFYCEQTERACSDENAVHMANGDTWSERAFDLYGFECEGNRRNYHRDEMVMLEDGTTWSQEYFDDHGATCDETGALVSADEIIEMDNGARWCQDHFDTYGEVYEGRNLTCNEAEDIRACIAAEAEAQADAEVVTAERKRIARKGRDESPLQGEMLLRVETPYDKDEYCTAEYEVAT